MIPDTTQRPSRDGLCLSDAKGDQARAWSAKRWNSRSNSCTPRKAFHSMVCNRLEVICHEDLDTLAAPCDRAVRRDRRSHSRGSATTQEASAKPG